MHLLDPMPTVWFPKQPLLFQVEVKEGDGTLTSETLEEAALQEPCKFPSSQEVRDASGSSQKDANPMVTMPERVWLSAAVFDLITNLRVNRTARFRHWFPFCLSVESTVLVVSSIRGTK